MHQGPFGVIRSQALPNVHLGQCSLSRASTACFGRQSLGLLHKWVPSTYYSSNEQLWLLAFDSSRARCGLEGVKFMRALSDPTQVWLQGARVATHYKTLHWASSLAHTHQLSKEVDCSGIAAESFSNGAAATVISSIGVV